MLFSSLTPVKSKQYSRLCSKVSPQFAFNSITTASSSTWDTYFETGKGVWEMLETDHGWILETDHGWYSIVEVDVALRPQRPYGLLGTEAQDVQFEFCTAPELWQYCWWCEAVCAQLLNSDSIVDDVVLCVHNTHWSRFARVHLPTTKAGQTAVQKPQIVRA